MQQREHISIGNPGAARRRGASATSIVLLLLLVLALPSVASAQDGFGSTELGGAVADGAAATSGALITSDKPDYAPGATVRLTGAGWQAGESIEIFVDDSENHSWQRNVTVIADENGELVDEFDLPDWFVAVYDVVATGAVSGVAASSFTDGNVAVATSGPAFTYSWARYPNTLCTGNASNSGTAAAGTSQAASGSQGVGLTAPATAHDASTFVRWTGPSGFNTTNRTICAPGDNGSGVVTYTAHYLTAAKQNQTITFTDPADATYGDAPVNLVATASSGLPVSFSATGACTIVGGTARIDTVGTCTVAADQGGNATYNAAPQVTQSFAIARKTLTAGITAFNKVYDRTAAAVIDARTLTGGVVGTDSVLLSGGTATFDSVNAGTGRTVTATGLSLSGAESARYQLASSTATTTAGITPRSVTGAFTAQNKTYDGTNAATIGGRSLTGVLAGDTASLAGGAASFADASAGTGRTVTGSGFSLAGAQAANYSLAPGDLTTTANIAPRSVTGSFTAQDKTYDGLTAATIASRGLANAVNGDDVELSGGSAAFESPGAGTGKTVNGSGFALSGTTASNYTLASSSLGTTADIDPREVTGAFTADDKQYDGGTSATISGRSLSNAVSGDAVGLTGGTAGFRTATIGEDKPVDGTGFALDGAAAGNYTLASSDLESTADITERVVTGTFTAQSRAYDGTDAASITDRGLSGAVDGESVSLTGGSATFSDAEVGDGKTVTGTGFALTGDHADHYTLASSTLTTVADITRRSLAVSFDVEDRDYDGTDAATITDRAVSGEMTGETVTLEGGSATFDSANAGSRQATATGFTLDGAHAGNYSLPAGPFTADGTIRPKVLDVAFTAADKQYDGTTDASVLTRSVTGRVDADDDVDLDPESGAAAFENSSVGTGKTVTLSGLALTGAAASNYALPAADPTAQADIDPRTVTATISAADKVYDGTTVADVTPGDVEGTVPGETVTLDGAAEFDSKDVGTRTASGTYSLAGEHAGSYELSPSILSDEAEITARPVTAAFTAEDKVYDGTSDATILTRGLPGRIGTDDVTVTDGTAAFADENVGEDKDVSASGFSLTGTDAGNYALSSAPAHSEADITARTVSGSFTAADKVYDGTTAATIDGRDLTGEVDGDAVELSGGTAAFGSPGVGVGKTVTGTGFALDGAKAGNYELADSELTTTASITKATLSVDADDETVPFGGTVTPSYTLSGFAAGEDAQTAGVTGAATCAVAPSTPSAVGEYEDVISCSPNTLDAADYEFAGGDTGDLRIVAAATTLTYTGDASGQYSDVPLLRARLVSDVTGQPLEGRTITFTIGSQSVSATTDADGVATAPASGTGALRIDRAVGTTTVASAFAGTASYTASSDSDAFQVRAEDARATYTGAMHASSAGSAANVTLAATIQDISAVSNADADPGDIRHAKVDFVNRGTGATVCSNLPVGLVSSGDQRVGTATCTWSAPIPSGGFEAYTIGMIVRGRYTRDDSFDNAVVNVSKPMTSFITGGGYIVNSSSAGIKAGEAGRKTNFGFNVKYNKSATSLQGNINAIVRNGARVYQVKGNSMSSLSAVPNATGGTATFNGKANIQDITDPLAVQSVDGNATLQVTMTDKGEPGSADLIGISVWNKAGGLWFASAWSGTRTVEQLLAGGNVVVR